MNLTKKKILLTGSNGFIGKNILESYLAEKYFLIAPPRDELDLGNEKSVDQFFSENKVDFVIHAACKAGHRNAKDTTNIFFENTKMFFNLIKHSDKFQRMINLGSGAIYDSRNYKPKMKEEYFGENIPQDEHGFCKYVVGKYIEADCEQRLERGGDEPSRGMPFKASNQEADCEQRLERGGDEPSRGMPFKASNQAVIKIVDLRIFGIFGKYEDYAIRFISNAICKTLFDLPVTIKQNRKFDYLYINDLMPILEYFIENKPKYNAYNITPDKSIELYELAEKVKKISGKNLPVFIKEKGLGLEYSADNSRLKNEFHELNFTEIDKAIKELYEWYNQNHKLINREYLLFDK